MAEILSVPTDEIALLPAVSAGVAALAASLRPSDEVVIPADEFNSLLLPFLVAERYRGVRVRRVPFEGLADSVTEQTTVVATSHVRSNGGAVQDLDAVSEAAKAHGALLAVDATHSAGIVPLEIQRRGLDVVYLAAYKHLLCPRGVAFMRLAREHLHRLQPYAASWRSTASPYASYYGGSLDDLASGAAQFDLSLAWHAWVGARESLRFLSSVAEEERRSWSVGLASRLAEHLDIPPTGSSVLGIPVEGEDREVRDLLQSATPTTNRRQIDHLICHGCERGVEPSCVGLSTERGRREEAGRSDEDRHRVGGVSCGCCRVLCLGGVFDKPRVC